MLRLIKRAHDQITKNKYSDNPWTNVYGLARSILALSLLCTLVFSGMDTLFPLADGEQLIRPNNFFFEKISIYHILGNVSFAYYTSIFILIFVISGYLPQITGILHWWVSYSYLASGIILEGGDQIIAIITLLLIPVTLTDRRLNHWSKTVVPGNQYVKFFIWSVYGMIILQVAVIYFHSAVAKFSVDEWLNGTATYYWFTHNTFGVPYSIKPFMAKLMSNRFMVITTTWGAILFELILAGWIFMKRNTYNWKLLFIAGIFFHLFIALIFGLASFGITMTGALVLYLFPKDKHFNFRRWRRSSS